MKNFKYLLLSAFVFLANIVHSQITVEPALPTVNDQVTVTFDATGTGLENETGDLYAHTGVILEGSSGWQHVVAEWTENIAKALLTPLGGNLYELVIEPSIKEYYGIEEGETVLLRVKLENTGEINYSLEAFGDELKVYFYEDSGYIGEANITFLPSPENSSKYIIWVSVPWTINKARDYYLVVEIDPYQDLPDNNKDNNK